MPRKILRLPIVLDRTGLSRSTVYQRVTEGRFPRPVSLGARAVGWIETEVEEWIARQVEVSREISGQRPASLPCHSVMQISRPEDRSKRITEPKSIP
jgi:prophage regulatory protein